MKIFRIYLLVSLILMFVQTFQINVLANSDWLKVNSENFLVVGDASENDLRQTAVKLENFRKVFTEQFPNIKFNSPIPTNVIVFKNQYSLNLYKQNRLAENLNYFQNGEDTNYIVVSAENLKVDSFQNIYHQYVHYLVDNAIGKSNISPWLYEGLAEIYEDFQIDKNGIITFGNLKENHVSFLNSDELLPFETFLNIDYYTLRQQERKEGEGLYYAQSWAFTKFLSQETNQTKFRQFIEQISQGKSAKDALISSFQKDFKSIENNFKDYINQKLFKNVQKKSEINLTLVSSSISTAETETYLGHLLYNLNRFDEAEKKLDLAIKLQSNLADAISLLGMVKVRQFQYDESRILGERAIEKDNQSYLNHFRYAYILSRRGMTEYGFVSGYNFAEADKMREALQKSINLNAAFAESYNLFALISFVRNDELNESLQLIEKAFKLAPGNQQYQLRLAELNMRKEKFTEARKLALAVLQNASEPGLRLYAQNTIQRIDSTEIQLMRSKSDKDRYINDDRVTDTPMSEEEIARRRAKAMLDSIRIGLRQPINGQTRISGMLLEVECISKEINFIVKTDNDIVKLRANSFEGLHLLSFNQNMFKTEIGCGVMKKENYAVIIYTKLNNTNSKISGELVSIEFVPKEFKLNGKQ